MTDGTNDLISDGFSIRPEDIEIRIFIGAFNNLETELAAARIVSFCQHNGNSWKPFSLEEILDFVQKSKYQDFSFEMLVDAQPKFLPFHTRIPGYRGGGWIIRNKEDGLFYVTEDFIRRCHKASPKNE
jgi:hypothetical protein